MVRRYHFSIDDVLGAVVAPAHPLLDFLAELHARHGATTDLYLFHRATVAGAMRALDEIPPSIADRLTAAAWLRFGLHAEDYETPLHAQSRADQLGTLRRVYDSLDRIVPLAQRARWLRFHYFSECFELADELRLRGVEALLTTDKEVGSYRLPESCRLELLRNGRTSHGGLAFIRSHLRAENLAREQLGPGAIEARLDRILAAHGCVVLFTHEADLLDEATRAVIHRCLDHLTRVGAEPV